MRLGENSITGDLNMPRGGGGEGLATAVEVGSFAGTGRYVYTHIYTSRSRCDEDTDVITFTQYKVQFGVILVLSLQGCTLHSLVHTLFGPHARWSARSFAFYFSRAARSASVVSIDAVFAPSRPLAGTTLPDLVRLPTSKDKIPVNRDFRLGFAPDASRAFAAASACCRLISNCL